MCLISFIGCRCARSPDVVSSSVSCVRPVGRLVLSIRSSLIACSYRSYSSCRASRFSSRPSSRLACSSRFFVFAFPGWRLVLSPCLRSFVSSYRLAGTSCLLVSFFFSFVLSSCGYGMRCSCVGGVFPYHPDRYAARFLRLVRSLPARSVTMMRYSHPSCVIRS